MNLDIIYLISHQVSYILILVTIENISSIIDVKGVDHTLLSLFLGFLGFLGF